MGFLVEEPENSRIHGEVRGTTFTLFTNFGDQRIELPWNDFANLEAVVVALRAKGEKYGNLSKTQAKRA